MYKNNKYKCLNIKKKNLIYIKTNCFFVIFFSLYFNYSIPKNKKTKLNLIQIH